MSRVLPFAVMIALLALWVVAPPPLHVPVAPEKISAPKEAVQTAPVLEPELMIPTVVPVLPVITELMPADSYRHRRAMHAAALKVYGRDAPFALLAAQVRAESAYKDQRSKAGAQGLAQFMPATAKLMADKYPAELAPARPNNAQWAFLAQAYLMRDLHALYPAANSVCDRWAFALSAYNGGENALNKERAMAMDPSRWFGHVEQKRWRRVSAFNENRSYVRSILYSIEPRYSRAGWDNGLACA